MSTDRSKCINCEHLSLGCISCSTSDEEPIECTKCIDNLQISADGYSCEFENCDDWTVFDEHFDKLQQAKCIDCADGFGYWETTHGCEPCENYFPLNDWTDCFDCQIDEAGIPESCNECGNLKTLIPDNNENEVWKVCDYLPIENCEIQNKDICKKCKNGYLNTLSECTECGIEGCLACEFDSYEWVNQCVECEEGMYLTKYLYDNGWWTELRQICAVQGEIENCIIHNKHN